MKKRITALLLVLGLLLAVTPVAAALTADNCFVMPYAQNLGRSVVVGQPMKLDAWVECDETAAQQGATLCVDLYQGSYWGPSSQPVTERSVRLTSATSGRFSVTLDTKGLSAGDYWAAFTIRDSAGNAVCATVTVDLYLAAQATELTSVGFVDSANRSVTKVTLTMDQTFDFMLRRQPYHATDSSGSYTLTTSQGGRVVAVDDFLGYFQLQPKAPGTEVITCTMDGYTATLEVTVEGQPVDQVFTDVNPNAFYAEALQYCYDAGLVNGMEEGRFGPEVALDRGMLVTLLYRMEGEPAPSGDNPFTDVGQRRYYRDPVVWAYENGIVNGRGDGIFDPESPVTRADLVTILYRYTAYKGGNLSGGKPLTGYSDANKVYGYARNAMSWAVGNGLIKGMTDTELWPNATATRAQFVTILYRYIMAQ